MLFTYYVILLGELSPSAPVPPAAHDHVEPACVQHFSTPTAAATATTAATTTTAAARTVGDRWQQPTADLQAGAALQDGAGGRSQLQQLGEYAATASTTPSATTAAATSARGPRVPASILSFKVSLLQNLLYQTITLIL